MQTEEKNWFYYHLAREYDQATADRYWDVKTGEWKKRHKAEQCYGVIYTWNGISGDAKFWAKKLGISKLTFYDRLKRHGYGERLFEPNNRL